MINLLQNKYDCTGCTACVSICPQKTIRMETDTEGFLYPNIDEERCVHCHLCEKICPVNGYTTESYGHQEAYAAYSLKDDVLKRSSSGGIFSEIAAYVIAQGGVVFGAAFTKEHAVKHIAVDTAEELDLLRGSKYLQSDMNDCYIQVKQLLDSGRLVLFTGTPCQVDGLKSYLKTDYDNLITQDIICHGVPSPLVWKAYLRQMEAKTDTSVSTVNFRDKKYGWDRYCLFVKLSNESEYRKNVTEDLYMRGFLANIYLRPSCYQCRNKSTNRKSDFTLADFWGIKHVCPEMENPDGTSLVWVNSEKAKAIWEEIRDGFVYRKVDIDKAVRYNSAAVSSVAMPPKRAAFFELIRNNSFEESINAVLPKDNFFKKLMRKAKKTVKSVMRIK
ncbi:MAG: Coenzyme F420 hydrogenase/dehydrogenase, beta subunit C-terminal domain [Oscillospiraceae bacterium]|nr:Coenzyme F420 hydrogenase/dehydrogenase, beta subunit C-terminal domain [Oscillospiraceae bacterium]